MKKNLFLLMAMIFATTVFCSCGDDKDEPKPVPDPQEFVYKAPCIQWHCTISDVRAFMKSYEGFVEDPNTYTDSGNTVYDFNHKDGRSYSYHIGKDGLVMSIVIYSKNNDFAKFQKQLSTAHGVGEWHPLSISDQYDMWDTTLKGKHTDITIATRKSLNKDMYAVFSYTEYDW
ncbi:MAG: hypothetical protein Q4E41_03015 [Bacteroidales bacterium]|nr:hypothetical protein [Bacteroidales bacterium]